MDMSKSFNLNCHITNLKLVKLMYRLAAVSSGTSRKSLSLTVCRSSADAKCILETSFLFQRLSVIYVP